MRGVMLVSCMVMVLFIEGCSQKPCVLQTKRAIKDVICLQEMEGAMREMEPYLTMGMFPSAVKDQWNEAKYGCWREEPKP